jgi:hypothetical protein
MTVSGFLAAVTVALALAAAAAAALNVFGVASGVSSWPQALAETSWWLCLGGGT